MKVQATVWLCLVMLMVMVRIICPIDGLDMLWTGKTKNVDAVILYEYRCLNGHISWARSQ